MTLPFVYINIKNCIQINPSSNLLNIQLAEIFKFENNKENNLRISEL
jgi:hypothetical protein